MNSQDDVLFVQERRLRISRLLREQKKVAVEHLCKAFDVSRATIRSDLRALQRDGLLTRTHGGAILRTQTAFEPLASEKSVQQLAEKQRIARAALKLIDDGDTIILDTGTTTMELARLLHVKQNLKVVTNDIQIAGFLEAEESVQVVLLGGILRRGFHCTVGGAAQTFTADLAVDKAFMGVNGMSPQRGATTPDVQHAETKKAMMSIANKVIILCDHTKIGRVTFAAFAKTDDIDILVTDALNSEDEARFREREVEVLIAK